jgi:transcriptional enhancer factor
VHLVDYDHHSNWQLPLTESFDTDPAWANYSVPSSTPQIAWDSDPKSHIWPEFPDVKPISWADETGSKHDWAPEPTGSPTKHTNYIEQSIARRLLPLIEHQNGPTDSQNNYVDVADAGIGNVPAEIADGKNEWNGADEGLDYVALTERLK